MNFTVGTAGHIDHGKTALVRALTGVDADRLPEEKRRGITIDLGFAELDLGAARFGFVDVPGHERFVKNMLAGASGIDIVALVVAADAGVMPQTREHFEICRLLDVKSGVVVITKTDLVDDELLELVKLDVAELIENSFLEHAPVVAVSAKTNAGIETLKQTLLDLAEKIPAREDQTVARLPIDRAFSVRGFGAVVTGTVAAGEIGETDEMQLLPVARTVRVRGLQTHNRKTEIARAGQRAAINLGGVEANEIKRGDLLAAADSMQPTQILNVRVEVLKDAGRALKTRRRVRVHIGTAEVLARVQILSEIGEIAAGEIDFAQLRLESAVVAVPGERFVIRSYSPQRTIAGGAIVESIALRQKRKTLVQTRARLEKLLAAHAHGDKAATLKIVLDAAGESGLTEFDLTARIGWRKPVLAAVLTELVAKKSVIAAGNVFLARAAFENLIGKTVQVVQAHHKNEPLARGLSRETLRERAFARLPAEIFRRVLAELEQRGQIISEKEIVRLASYSQNLAQSDRILLEKLIKIYTDADLEVPNLDSALAEAVAGTKTTKDHARKIFQLLLDSREVARVTNEFYFRRAALDRLIEKLRLFAASSSDCLIDVAQFKELGGFSRKYAIPLLEYFDREKITSRAGDKRLILITTLSENA